MTKKNKKISKKCIHFYDHTSNGFYNDALTTTNGALNRYYILLYCKKCGVILKSYL